MKYYSSHKNEWIGSSVETWMGLESVIQSEISQKEKNKYCILIYILESKKNHMFVCVCVLVVQLCLILCDPMDHSSSGSSVHGILQSRILEWVAISFSRGSSQPRDRTLASYTASRFFTIWAIRGKNGVDDPIWKPEIETQT